jgi:hypothetical protein
MTPFAWGVALLVVCVVAYMVERIVRLCLRLRRAEEASAWGCEL